MIWQMIEDWFRGILTDGILSNLSGLFDSVNTEVGEIIGGTLVPLLSKLFG